MVPEGWSTTRLGKVFKSRREKGREGLPTLSVTLNDGLVLRESLERKTDTNLSPDEHLLVRKGDIAYNMMRMWQGASGLAQYDAIVSPAYVVLKPTAEVNSVFASYLFKSAQMIHLFWAYSYGLTNDRLRLYYTDFSLIPVTLPPKEEQCRIGEVLETCDRHIAVLDVLLENSKKKRGALRRRLLAGQFHFGQSSQNDWQFDRFGDLFRVVNDKRTQIQKGDYASTGSTPIVDQGAELISGYTDTENVYRDVPVTIFGDHTRLVKWVDFQFCPGADGTQILKTTKKLSSKFGYYLLLAARLPNLGYSRHMRELKERDFFYPTCLEEQARIASILTTFDKEIDNYTAQRRCLVLEKQALMQQLIPGKRRLNAGESIDPVRAARQP